MKKKHKDPQKKAVYAWELKWAHWNNDALTDKQIKHWIKWASSTYGVKPPKFIGKSKIKSSYYDHSNRTIALVKDHRNVASVLHETAHHIADVLLGRYDGNRHGDKWLGIYMTLLLNAHIAPGSALAASVKEAKLVYDHKTTPLDLWPQKKKDQRRKKR